MKESSHVRLVLALCAVAVVLGVAALVSMPREEDPAFPSRFGTLTVFFPGAATAEVDRSVAQPLAEELAQVSELRYVDSTAREGVAVLTLELQPNIYDTHYAWDEVREAISRAKERFPSGVAESSLRDDATSTDSMIFVVTGSHDRLALRNVASVLRQQLLRVEGVARVHLLADPGDEVRVTFDDGRARALGVDQGTLAAVLRDRGHHVPVGMARAGDLTVALSTGSSFETVEQLARVAVPLPNGGMIPLGEVAVVSRGPRAPLPTILRHNGAPAVGISVVPASDVHSPALGERVRETIAREERDLAPISVSEVSFQPDYVQARLLDLAGSLVIGLLVVASVLLFFLSARSAWVVVTVIPLVALSTLAAYWALGGVLQQISVAAIVLSLGMVVDNAIVVTEGIQTRIDRGMQSFAAARAAVKELRIPLFTATLTTIGGFLPMLVAEGTTADFVRSLPIILMISLSASAVVAVTVTPLLAARLLRRNTEGEGQLERLGGIIGTFATTHSKTALAFGGVGLVVALVGLPLVDQQFFPEADRDVLVVEVRLREGSRLASTDAAVQRLEAFLREHRGVAAVTSFVGEGAPHFYYNFMGETYAPSLAQLMVRTDDVDESPALIADIRQFLMRDLPEVAGRVVVLQQGPAAKAPVEMRIYSEDPAKAKEVSDRVLAAFHSASGARDATRDFDFGLPAMRFEPVDSRVAARGIGRADLAMAVAAHTQGLWAGEITDGTEPAPIFVHSSVELEPSLESIEAAYVTSARTGDSAPLRQLAAEHVSFEPAVIHRRNGKRLTRVFAELAPGIPVGEAVERAETALVERPLPDGVVVERGGQLEGAAEANEALATTAPLGFAAIVLCLLWQFRSFRKVAIVLATIPLAAVGVVPGLVLAQQPFGFMALLGIIAIAGIVVNNAIILLDVVEREMNAGHSIEESLVTSVRDRARAIVLTTITTVGGLLPLCFSKSTLWPPLGWAMVSGLLASTLLTLLIVPALFRYLFRARTFKHRGRAIGAVPHALRVMIILCSCALLATDAEAQRRSPRESPPLAAEVDAATDASFDLGQLVQPSGLTREQAVRRVLAMAPRLRGAHAYVSERERLVVAAALDMLPRISVQGRATYFDTTNAPLGDALGLDPAGLPTLADPTAQTVLSNLLAASFPVVREQLAISGRVTVPVSDLFLTLLPALQAAEGQADAARYLRDAVEQELALQTEVVFLDVLRARGVVAVAEASFHSYVEHLRQVRAYARADAAAGVDVRQAEAEMAGAEVALERARGAQNIAEERLRVLLHLELGEPIALGEDVLALDTPTTPPLASLLAHGLEHRPEVLAAEAMASAAGAAHVAAIGAALPRLYGVADATLANPNPQTVPQLARYQQSFAVSAILEWSLSDSLVNGARAHAQAAAHERALASVDSTREQVRLEIVSAYHRARATLEALRAARLAVEAAEAVFRVRQAQLRARAVIIGDLLDSTARLSAARLELLEAAVEVQVARASIERAAAYRIR